VARPTSHLTSTASDRVKAVRALHSRSGRRKAGRFLVEGPQAVRAARDSGVAVHEIYVDHDALSSFADVIGWAEQEQVPVTTAEPHVIAAMGETEHPQGVLAVCALLDASRLAEVLAIEAPVVILDRVADPGNVGTIIRTAEAVGAAGVILTPECADVHGGKVVRATTGSLFRVPVVPDVPMTDVIVAVRAERRALAVAMGAGEVSLFEAVDSRTVCKRTCYVIGSEAHGVSDEAVAAADITIRIPMAPGVESLNAGVSAAVILYVLAHGARSGAFGPDGFR
jgi:TrmH family RNA methyltransferase